MRRPYIKILGIGGDRLRITQNFMLQSLLLLRLEHKEWMPASILVTEGERRNGASSKDVSAGCSREFAPVTGGDATQRRQR